MSDEVTSAETAWQQAKSTHGEDHPETRNLRGILDAAKQRQANRDYQDSLRRHEEQQRQDAQRHQDEERRTNPKPHQDPPEATEKEPKPPVPPFSAKAVLAAVLCIGVLYFMISPPRSPVPPPQPRAPISRPVTPPIAEPHTLPTPVHTEPRIKIEPEPVRRHYGSVRDDLLRSSAEPEYYVHMLMILSEANGQPEIADCLRAQTFGSPKALVDTVTRLWQHNAANLEAAVDHALMEPCLAGALSTVPVGSFGPERAMTGAISVPLRIRAAFRAARHYASRYTKDPKAAACLAEQEAQLTRTIPGLPEQKTYSPYPVRVYDLARQACGFMPEGLATLPDDRTHWKNLPYAATRRQRHASALDQCSSTDVAADRSCSSGSEKASGVSEGLADQ